MAETSRLIPDEVASQDFSHGFRGYDVREVRAFLRSAASEIARLSDEVVRLSSELVVARHQPSDRPRMSRDEVTEYLGEEAARVLRTAEDAGRDIQSRAEENVERMLREARAEAAEIRSAAQQDGADVVEAAERRVFDLEEDAKSRHTASVEAASRTRTEAFDYARGVVEEAKTARKQVLMDLAGRRQRARREIIQLRAGIDQLSETYDELRSLLDSSVRVLDTSVDDARNAAISAAEAFDHSDAEDDVAVVEAAAPEVKPLTVTESETVDSEEPNHDSGGAAEGTIDPTHDVDTVTTTRERREAARRTIVQRERRPEPPPGTVPQIEPLRNIDDVEPAEAVDIADSIGQESGVDLDALVIDTMIDSAMPATPPTTESNVLDDRVDEPTDTTAAADADTPEDEASEEQPVDEVEAAVAELEAGVSVDDEPPILPDLLDDGPVPEHTESPPLFGLRDSNIDELFKRIRSSRSIASAVAGVDSAHVPAASIEEPEQAAPQPVQVRAAAWTEAELFQAVDDMADLKSSASSGLKRALADQLNEVLDAHRRVDHPGSVDDLLPNDSPVFGGAISSVLAEAGHRGQQGTAFDLDLSAVEMAVSADVGGALRRRVANLVELGEDNLDAHIRGVYREWRRDRVEEVARQATTAAFNLGVLSTLPPGARVRWATRGGGCPVAECAENAAAGEVPAGSQFPSGHVVPPVTAGCRCLVVPTGQ
ncbi:MAG: DivIVA domain-containing protein [Actinomycetia bacterium]|nr:DivIVA domain-containing protein [Actinomycetes bacterium]MCP4961545.1 DivIVA domain-containing protein [Actinomycetes bacterium]